MASGPTDDGRLPSLLHATICFFGLVTWISFGIFYLEAGLHGVLLVGLVWVAGNAMLFRARYALVRGYAGEIGLDLIGIDSNVSELLMMNFQQTHVPRNVAPALLLQRLLGKYYYASGYRYQDAFIGATHDLAYSDAASVHLLSTETLDCISSGSQYSRVEKTARVAAIPGAERWLNVCVRSDGDGTNCSTCWKCCRTLFTLEVLGELARFAQAFDLESWARVRSGYIRSTILGDVGDPFVREIREHCDKVGYRFPRRDILAAKVLRLRRMLPRS